MMDLSGVVHAERRKNAISISGSLSELRSLALVDVIDSVLKKWNVSKKKWKRRRDWIREIMGLATCWNIDFFLQYIFVSLMLLFYSDKMSCTLGAPPPASQ